MNASELIKAIKGAGIADGDDPLVVFQDHETGEIFSIQEVVYEAQSEDGEGNPTSTGSTLFVRGEVS